MISFTIGFTFKFASSLMPFVSFLSSICPSEKSAYIFGSFSFKTFKALASFGFNISFE